MNILVDAVAARTGGGASRTKELASALPSLSGSHRFAFAVQPSLAETVRSVAPDSAVLIPPPILARPPLRLLWENTWLTSLSGFRPDVVISPFNVVPFWRGTLQPRTAVIVSNLLPFASDWRGAYQGGARLRLEALRLLTSRSLARADKIFLLSRQAYELIDERLLAGKAELLPMPPPAVPAVLPSPRHAPTRPYFVVASDLLRYKGIESVVDALTLISPERRPAVLLCGRPTEVAYARRIELRARRAGIHEWLEFVGPTSHAEMLALMRGARGTLVPSRFENPGRVPIEAMAVGSPLLVSDIVPFRDSCGEAALYARADDARAWADGLTLLLDDHALRDRLTRAGHERVGSLHAMDAARQIMRWVDTGEGRSP